MPFTKEKFVKAIKEKSPELTECAEVAASLVQEHGDKCVTIMCNLSNPDRESMGISSVEISTLLLETTKSILGNENHETIQIIHFQCLKILEVAFRRTKKVPQRNTLIKSEMIDIFEILLTKELNQDQYASDSDDEEEEKRSKDAAIETIRTLTTRAVEMTSDLRIESVQFLWRNDFKEEALEVAATIKPDDDYYEDACFYLGVYAIENGSMSYDTYYAGLKYLLEIGEDHEKHPNKSPETKKHIDKAIKKIKGFRKGMQGLVVKTGMSIFRSSKKERKICPVPDTDNGSNLTLHERQSLVERIMTTTGVDPKKKNLERSGFDKYNHLIVNVGFIVTDRPWKKGGDHLRRFCTMPVLVNNNSTLVGSEHTEPSLYDFLSDKDNLTMLVLRFKERFGIKEDGHKVYGVVIDCHSIFDMCSRCFLRTDSFYESWRTALLAVLKDTKFHLPKERNTKILQLLSTPGESLKSDVAIQDNQHFNIVIRYTSNSDYSPKGNPGVREGKDVSGVDIDIKQSDRHLLIHGSSNWHRKWTQESRIPNALKGDIPIENWTMFVTSQSPVIKRGNFNYSNLGMLDLTRYSLWTSPDEITAGVGDLAINP